MTEEKSLDLRPLDKVRSYLFQNKKSIESLLPSTENPVQYLAQAFNFVCQNPVLTQCSIESLFQAVKDAAQSNLALNGYMGEAYIIKYGNQAKFQIGYKGILKHIYNTGDVTYAYANPVYKGEHFKYQYGTNEYLEHIPEGREGDTDADILYFYGILKLKDGYTAFKVMTKDEIDKVRRISKCPNSPAWTNFYPSMGCKSVLIRVANTMKKATKELRESISIDQEAEFGSLNPSTSERLEDKTAKMTKALSERLGAQQSQTSEPRANSSEEIGIKSLKKEKVIDAEPMQDDIERCPDCGYEVSVCGCRKQPSKEKEIEQIDYTKIPYPGKKKEK
ncbi:MAG TPA: recombinase RecT [Candidatus Wunengus sp. YC60]|uniref:recombinase RecT n=1 Tax=Candidatus Wunengus sp. YC60 TaxID=3367697 RepID=UPI004029463B